MADCQLLGGCIFFNDKMASKPTTAEMMKDTYCRGDNNKCARFTVFKTLGKPAVPADLYPNQADRARTILSTR